MLEMVTVAPVAVTAETLTISLVATAVSATKVLELLIRVPRTPIGIPPMFATKVAAGFNSATPLALFKVMVEVEVDTTVNVPLFAEVVKPATTTLVPTGMELSALGEV